MAPKTLIYAFPIANTHGHFASHKSSSLYSARTFWFIHTSWWTLQNVYYASQTHSIEQYCIQPNHRVLNSIDGAPCQHLISEYADVYKPELRQHPSVPAKHGVFHHVTTFALPTYYRFRRFSPQKLTAAKASFYEMERMGICSKSSILCASLLYMVSTSDGSWRTCRDYRRFNIIPEPDHYPMPNITTLQIVLVVHVSSPIWT